jgi:hypothetical protein
MRIAILICGLIGLCACAEDSTLQYGNLNLPQTGNLHQDIVCRYRKQTGSDQQLKEGDWFFWRQGNRTETRDDVSHQGEIWERQQRGGYFYTHLFFDEKVALEFTPGDLAALNSAPSQPQFFSLIAPAVFGKELLLVGESKPNGISVESYKGYLKGMSAEVDWLPALQLPARIEKTGKDGNSLKLILESCGKPSEFKVQPAHLDSFRRLDFTDLGDMEDDSQVQRIEKLLGCAHHH